MKTLKTNNNNDDDDVGDETIIYNNEDVIIDDENYITITRTTSNGVVQVVTKRRSANKKERRRTQSINSAFSNLRDCIPNVPADTKLSKIKTLRLATSYISYLMKILDSPYENCTKLLTEGFRADLTNAKRSTQQNRIETQNVSPVMNEMIQLFFEKNNLNKQKYHSLDLI
ncbi:basic helix-loop-helix transcription factor-like protein [Euroglyphus maynei]|uniref:Basic helix-loop-helix transcription factor-like protein n=1 Tax=Euroglyphus maynei TaxID=6958 RepID=A0A1Y3BE95_EURMA|nr:basic helix-loop-helix transcription factor-like protein [Euroglyphus maynei]